MRETKKTDSRANKAFSQDEVSTLPTYQEICMKEITRNEDYFETV